LASTNLFPESSNSFQSINLIEPNYLEGEGYHVIGEY